MTDADIMTKAKSRFVYVTFIRTTPEPCGPALTDAGVHQAVLVRHAPWSPTGRSDRPGDWCSRERPLADAGESLASDPPRRLVIKWRNEFRPELKAEGYAYCTIRHRTGGRRP